MLFFKKWGQFPRGFPAEATPFLPPYCTFDACAVCRSLLVLECEVGRVFSTPTSFNRSEHANLSQKGHFQDQKQASLLQVLLVKVRKKCFLSHFFPSPLCESLFRTAQFFFTKGVFRLFAKQDVNHLCRYWHILPKYRATISFSPFSNNKRQIIIPTNTNEK